MSLTPTHNETAEFYKYLTEQMRQDTKTTHDVIPFTFCLKAGQTKLYYLGHHMITS